MVLLEMKKLTTINAVKREVKKWKPENCPAGLCKSYIQSVGFVNAYSANAPFFDSLKTSENLKPVQDRPFRAC